MDCGPGATSETDLPIIDLQALPERRGSFPHPARSGPLPCQRFSAVVDLVRHGCMEVRIFRKQRVEVGHHAVLINEGMGPVEVGVPGASHHLALVVDARGYCASLRGIESRIGSQLHESLLSDN